MTSRLVTVDLILTVSLRLRRWELLPIFEEGSLEFYASIRELLNHWARQIEEQGLSISLEAIAENATQIYQSFKGEASWERLTQIGDSLIERAREIEGLILNRSMEVLRVPRQKEISNALREGQPVKFAAAAMAVTEDGNSTRAQKLMEKFLTWVCDYAGDAERSLLGDVIEGKRELTTGAVELFKRSDYFRHFNAVYRGTARKRKKK
jgi:hypothetical protein